MVTPHASREQTYVVSGRTLVARVEPLFFEGEWGAIVARFLLREQGSSSCLLGCGSSSPLRRVPDFMDVNYISRTYPSLPFTPQEVYRLFEPLTTGLCSFQPQ